MYDGVAFGRGTTNDRRAGRGDKYCQLVLQTVLAPRKPCKRWAGETVVVATDTHDDEQEYTEDGNDDCKDENDRDDDALNVVNLSYRRYHARGLTDAGGGHG
jgi:hypothetical protein